MKNSRAISSLCLSVLFSGSVFATDLVEIETFPEWFKDAMGRDTELTSMTELDVEAFNVSTAVKGDATLVERGERYIYYQINIDSDSPVECYAFSRFDGPANTLHSLVENSLQSVENLNNKTLSSRFNYAVDAGVIEQTPYVLLDTLYSLGEGDKKVTGVLKGMAARTGSSLQACIHNEIGYRQAFLDVFTSFLNGFARSQAQSTFYEAVYAMEFNGTSIGYIQETHSLDKDGDVESREYASMLLPVDASNISRSDSEAIEWSRPDGSLINTVEQSIENGVLSSDFALQVKDEAWHVSGSMQGKAIDTTLAYDDWLLSAFGSHLQVRELQQSDQETASVNMWIAEADPTSVQHVTISKIENNTEANLKLDMGPVMFEYLTDDNGVMQQGVMQHGPINMQMSLMSVNGKPLLP